MVRLATLRPANAVEGEPSCAAPAACGLGSGSGSAFSRKRAHYGSIDDVGDQNSPVIGTVQNQDNSCDRLMTASMRTVA